MELCHQSTWIYEKKSHCLTLFSLSRHVIRIHSVHWYAQLIQTTYETQLVHNSSHHSWFISFCCELHTLWVCWSYTDIKIKSPIHKPPSSTQINNVLIFIRQSFILSVWLQWPGSHNCNHLYKHFSDTERAFIWSRLYHSKCFATTYRIKKTSTLRSECSLKPFEFEWE